MTPRCVRRAGVLLAGLALCLFIPIPPAALHAQVVYPEAADARAPGIPRRDAYSTLTFGASAVGIASSGALDEYWTPGTGVRADAFTPFHVGEIGASLGTARFAARTADQPSFRAFLIALEWRFASRQPGWWIQPDASVAAGDFLTLYDGVDVKGLANESELYAGASVGAAVPLFRNTTLTARATALHVFTSTPIRLVTMSVGVAHTITTPGWIHGAIE